MKNKLFKQSLSALLALVLVLSTLLALPLTVGAADATAWDGTTTTKPSGAGTQADPYQIATGANLAWLSANTGTVLAPSGALYLSLTADINLGGQNFTPIALRTLTAPETYSYKAIVLEGNGKTISGLKIENVEVAALFAYAGNNSSFKNVKFVGATIASTAVGTGAVLVGQTYGNTTLEGIQTDATSVVNARKAGGIMGVAVNTASMTTATKCVNRATVIATADGDNSPRVGGIICEIEKMNSLDMSWCVNEGAVTINAMTKSNTNIGGLVGWAAYAGEVDAPSKVSFTDCYNVGTLSSTVTTGSGVTLGGILGRAQAGTMNFTRVYDYSIRNVQGGTSVAMVGHGAKTECVKNYTDMYACNHPDSVTPYDRIHGLTDGDATRQTYTNVDKAPNSANIKISLLQTIVLKDGATAKNSTMLDEMTKIAGMAGTTAPVPAAAANDGLARDYAWYVGADGTLVADKGTEAAPYEISTPAQWAAFSALSNGTHDVEATKLSADPVDFSGKYFKLTADIDLTGYICDPVALNAAATIVLDGAGHTISNLKQEKVAIGGLFGALEDGSVIKNLTLTGFDLSSSGSVGGFVGSVTGGMTLSNCIIKDSTLAGKGTSGGLVGFASSLNAENRWFITACVNEADISVEASSAPMVGGLVGNIIVVSGVEITIRYCVNKGDLSVTSSATNTAVGGLLGRVQYSGPIEGVVLIASHCYNTGTLAVTATVADISIHTAGFIGWGFFGGELYLEWCHDYSARKNDTKGSNAGAIGNCANTELIKMLDECYGMNTAESEAFYSAMYGATRNASTLSDSSCAVVMAEDEEVTFYGAPTTLKAELERIDAVLASVDKVTGAFEDPNANPPAQDPSDPTPGTPDPEQPKPEDPKPEDNKTEDTTTKAPDTTAAPSGGCGSSVTATFAVVAMTALCGMAIVGKKKED